MDAFLLLSLSAEPAYTYRQPLLQAVKETAPAWAALDVDSFSDENLIAHAARLVREAERVVAVFKAPQPDASLGACQLVLEEIIQRKQPAVILLQGSHRRLQAIFQARPHFTWRQADSEADLLGQLQAFLNPGPSLPAGP
jgi:hypothetical protein